MSRRPARFLLDSWRGSGVEVKGMGTGRGMGRWDRQIHPEVGQVQFFGIILDLGPSKKEGLRRVRAWRAE